MDFILSYDRFINENYGNSLTKYELYKVNELLSDFRKEEFLNESLFGKSKTISKILKDPTSFFKNFVKKYGKKIALVGFFALVTAGNLFSANQKQEIFNQIKSDTKIDISAEASKYDKSTYTGLVKTLNGGESSDDETTPDNNLGSDDVIRSISSKVMSKGFSSDSGFSTDKLLKQNKRNVSLKYLNIINNSLDDIDSNFHTSDNLVKLKKILNDNGVSIIDGFIMSKKLDSGKYKYFYLLKVKNVNDTADSLNSFFNKLASKSFNKIFNNSNDNSGGSSSDNVVKNDNSTNTSNNNAEVDEKDSNDGGGLPSLINEVSTKSLRDYIKGELKKGVKADDIVNNISKSHIFNKNPKIILDYINSGIEMGNSNNFRGVRIGRTKSALSKIVKMYESYSQDEIREYEIRHNSNYDRSLLTSLKKAIGEKYGSYDVELSLDGQVSLKIDGKTKNIKYNLDTNSFETNEYTFTLPFGDERNLFGAFDSDGKVKKIFFYLIVKSK